MIFLNQRKRGDYGRRQREFIHSFTHSGYFYSPSSSQLIAYLLALPTLHGYSRLSVIVSEFQAEAPQDSASEEVAHGEYVAARAEIQHAKCAESNYDPPRTIKLKHYCRISMNWGITCGIQTVLSRVNSPW